MVFEGIMFFCSDIITMLLLGQLSGTLHLSGMKMLPMITFGALSTREWASRATPGNTPATKMTRWFHTTILLRPHATRFTMKETPSARWRHRWTWGSIVLVPMQQHWRHPAHRQKHTFGFCAMTTVILNISGTPPVAKARGKHLKLGGCKGCVW